MSPPLRKGGLTRASPLGSFSWWTHAGAAQSRALPDRQRRPACHAQPDLRPRTRERDYLQRILTAKVYDVASESPLELARSLSRRTGNHVLLKREDTQAGVQLQAARRVQQDGASVARAARARRDLRVGRQPRAGRGAGRAQARLPRRDRDAGDDAAGEDRRGAGAGRRGRAARRQLFRRLRARARAAEGREARASCTPSTTPT